MISGRRAGRLALFISGALLLAALPALSQMDFGFMPRGGKALLLDLLGDPPDRTELRKIAGARRSEAEWRDDIAAREPPFDDRERDTLAAYLAVNMPLPPEILKREAPEAALPRDGRDLAWGECQYCHSLFTSHLTQDRDVQGWRNIFLSPFHRGMKMSEQEREEFARYSAINMPMTFEDVPEDLRF